MKIYPVLLILLLPKCSFSQKVLSENLSPKVKVYWDAENRKLHSSGSYYIDERHPETTEKHGKWLFYSLSGTLEEERNYYRNRVHGKQTIYFPNKKIKQVYYSKFNVADSIFKEFNEVGTLIMQGYYELGSPTGKWLYYYPDSSLWKEEVVITDCP